MNSTRTKSFSLSKIFFRGHSAARFALPSKRSEERVFCFTKFLVFVTLIVGLFAIGQPAFAQGNNVASSSAPIIEGVNIIRQPLGLPTTDIRVIIANIVKAALSLIGIIMVVLMLYGGFLWMTAGGNDEQIGSAKKVITNAALGLLIILTAYAIVAFVIRLFGIGTGEGNVIGLTPPGTQNFSGSGALGQIVKDHYPRRDQIDVPRNTKIIITFRKPVKPDSFIDDKSGNNQYGDCRNVGPGMNWVNDCDSLKLDSDHILIARADNGAPISGASVLAYNDNGKYFTIVIRPYDYLGSATQNIQYKVHIGNKVLLDDPANGNPGAFTNRAIGNLFYEWKFTCSTVLDTAPPYVLNTFPGNGLTEDKNSVVQIDFSEAMDPTGVQGSFSAQNNYFVLEGNTIFLKSAYSSIPIGNFNLTNGYQTLEFTPTVQCATNACGSPIFCLPVCDTVGAQCSTDQSGALFDTYKMLVRAAQTFSTSSFEAIPFSGAADVSGNALNGDNDSPRAVDVVDRLLPVFAQQGNPASQEAPDNFAFSFRLRDHIDLTPPILNQITPGLDAENITANQPLTALWNKRMRIEPFYNGATIAEHPTAQERGDNIPLCVVPRISFFGNGTTSSSLDHCPFLDARRQYYYPTFTSAIEDAHFNCFYPGVGPGGLAELQAKKLMSATCDAQGNNCCAVDANQQNQQFCCNGLVDQGRQTVATCNQYLNSISPP